MANRRPISPHSRGSTADACLRALLVFICLAPVAAQEPDAPLTGSNAATVEIQSAMNDAEPMATDTAAIDTGSPPTTGVPLDDGTGTEGPTGPELDQYISRIEAQLSLRDLLDLREYQAAVPVAVRVVELTDEEFGTLSSENGVAVSNLAETQRRARLYEEAERNFLAAVNILRATDGEFAVSVITPLIGLGVTYQAMNRHPQAVTVLEEARTVSRRVGGLLNERQVEILDHIANSMIGMELYEEAELQKLHALRIMERIHGSDTLEILPALYKHALWLRNGYRYQQERDYYSRAMTIVRSLDGKESPLLAQPLRQIGNSFRVQKLPEGRGIGSLKRALEILQSQPEPDKLQMARVLRDIGDWNVAFSKIGPTGDEYRQAWSLLSELEDGEQVQRRWFFEPDYVLHEYPSTRGLADPGEPGAQAGHVLVTFNVLPSGRTANIAILESVPPGFKDESSARSIARSRFRPRLVDGEPVVAAEIARDFTFYYTPRGANGE